LSGLDARQKDLEGQDFELGQNNALKRRRRRQVHLCAAAHGSSADQCEPVEYC